MAVFDLKNCNEPRYKKRADYGIRVARPGYDANNCEQNQLIFNSNWPIIQIAKIIDLNKETETLAKWSAIVDGKRVWGDERPAGSSYVGGTDVDSFNVTVGSNYVYIVTRKEIYYAPGNIMWTKFEYKKIKHGLGYCPMFYRSNSVAGVSGYLILTSVDLNVDVDYPYTEGATMFFGDSKDYGIKSASVFGKKVPGLCTNMFSRLIQAVKTSETSKYKYLGPAGVMVWSPLKEMKDWEKCLEPFEAVAYNGYSNPFREQDYDSVTLELYQKFGNDYPYYCDDEAIVRTEPYDNTAADTFDDGVAFTTLGQSAPICYKTSMVVSRSPMVSPEYEEVEI